MTAPPVPGKPNLHVALAMAIPEATPSWTDEQLIKAVRRYVQLAERDTLFAAFADEDAA